MCHFLWTSVQGDSIHHRLQEEEWNPLPSRKEVTLLDYKVTIPRMFHLFWFDLDSSRNTRSSEFVVNS